MFRIGKSLIVTFLVIFLYAVPAFAATSIPFTVNLSKAVNVTGTPRIAVDVGGITPTRYASYTSGSGTSTLIFTYTMVAGDVDLDGVTLTPSIDLNGGTIKDLAGNDLSPLTFTAPNTANVKVNYPSLGMDFVADADGRYTLNGAVYNDLTSFLSAAGGSFTRASVGTYFDSSGVLQTAASGTPRFDYDPVTHAAKGILIEENRTNLLKGSDDITNSSYYSTSQVSYTANTISAPNGSLTADLLTRTGTSGSVYYQQPYAGSTGAYTASAYVKIANTGNYFGLRLQGTYPDRADAKFNLSNGTLVGTTTSGYTSASGSINNVGNGWYRVTLSATAAGTSVSRVIFGPADSSTSVGSWETGNSTLSDIYVWGAQLEQGTFATSYIPTTSAAVTRATDQLYLNYGAGNVPSWYNTPEGAVFAQFYPLANAQHPNAQQIVYLSANKSNTNRVHLFRNQTTNTLAARIIENSSNIIVTNNPAIAENTVHKAALGYSSTTTTAYVVNGGVQTTAGAAAPVNISHLDIGGDGFGTAALDGYIKTIKYYPLRVSNAQLQLLTQ